MYDIGYDIGRDINIKYYKQCRVWYRVRYPYKQDQPRYRIRHPSWYECLVHLSIVVLACIASWIKRPNGAGSGIGRGRTSTALVQYKSFQPGCEESGVGWKVEERQDLGPNNRAYTISIRFSIAGNPGIIFGIIVSIPRTTSWSTSGNGDRAQTASYSGSTYRLMRMV